MIRSHRRLRRGGGRQPGAADHRITDEAEAPGRAGAQPVALGKSTRAPASWAPPA